MNMESANTTTGWYQPSPLFSRAEKYREIIVLKTPILIALQSPENWVLFL